MPHCWKSHVAAHTYLHLYATSHETHSYDLEFICVTLYMALCMRSSCSNASLTNGPRRDKSCLKVSDKARLKPVSSVTETKYNSEISLVASFDIMLFNKRIKRR